MGTLQDSAGILRILGLEALGEYGGHWIIMEVWGEMGVSGDTGGITRTLGLGHRNIMGVLGMEGIGGIMGALGERATVRTLGLGGTGEAIGNIVGYWGHWDWGYGNIMGILGGNGA